MPRAISPFTSSQKQPTQSSSPSDKPETRRTSLSKANQRLHSLFSPSAKNKQTDAQALAAASAAQQAYMQSPSPTATLSLPTISLSTATGEKSQFPNDNRSNALYRSLSPAEAKKLARQHAQFGPIGSQEHRYSSRFVGDSFPAPIEDEPPYYFFLTTYISYLLLIILGHVLDFFGKRFNQKEYDHLRERDGYAPMNSDFDSFYVRRLKNRIEDVFARPVTGVPGRFVTLLDRKYKTGQRKIELTGTTTETLNVSSYNYLGFAQSEGPCADAVEQSIQKYGIATSSTRADAGTTDLHLEVEQLISDFVGKQASMVFSMGFATNATIFPALVGKGDLVISDELNHSSIRFGMRLSGALVQTFKHNDMADLEHLLREVISQGQPRTHRPWKKILIAVEGLYSMEGTMCNLPAIVALRDKYKFYLFVDEAHSIGALGPRGRGVCDYFGIDPARVDILMGTLTKSFGANGGYVSGDKAIIDKLRIINAGVTFSESPTPPILMQISTSLRLIRGDIEPGQGQERLERLAFNSRYLRLGLKRLGFIISGHDDSPIVPLMLYNPGKMSAFSHEMLRRKISVVVVGYPATPLASARARFCLSAAHTKDDLDRLLEACNEIGEVLQLKYSSGIAGGAEPIPDGHVNTEEDKIQNGQKTTIKPPRWALQDVLARGVQDVKVTLR